MIQTDQSTQHVSFILPEKKDDPQTFENSSYESPFHHCVC